MTVQYKQLLTGDSASCDRRNLLLRFSQIRKRDYYGDDKHPGGGSHCVNHRLQYCVKRFHNNFVIL